MSFRFHGSAQTHSLSLGESRRFTPRISGEILGGVSAIQQENRTGYTGLANAHMSAEVSRQLRLDLQTGVDTNTTSGVLARLIQSRFVTGGASYQFDYGLRFSSSVRYYYNHDIRGFGDVNSGPIRTNSVTADVRLTYLVTRWLDAEASYQYTVQNGVNSARAADDFIRSQIGGGVLVRF